MRPLWHVSDDPSIERFEPRAKLAHDSPDALVWAIDEEHLPAYWFPRECPRATFWAVASTDERDVERFLAGDRLLRIHAVQATWLAALRTARMYAYRLPSASFERYERANGYWVSHAAVAPVEVVELGDLLVRHTEAGIELRIVPRLLPLWERVAASTLEYSGIRLRNLSAASEHSPGDARGDLMLAGSSTAPKPPSESDAPRRTSRAASDPDGRDLSGAQG
jgi:hypothetical protein